MRVNRKLDKGYWEAVWPVKGMQPSFTIVNFASQGWLNSNVSDTGAKAL